MSTFTVLLTMELKKFRQGWIWALALSCLFPMAFLLFMRLTQGSGNSAVAFYTVSAVLLMNAAMNSAMVLGPELAQLKEMGVWDYYATLPVKKHWLILAVLTRALIFSLPSLAMLILLGFWAYGIRPPVYALFALPILGLTIISLAGFGALIGLSAPNPRLANLAMQTVYLFVVFASPVMIPEESLPKVLAFSSSLLPTTYAAAALKSLFLTGSSAAGIFKEAAALAFFAAISVYFLLRSLQRRGEND